MLFIKFFSFFFLVFFSFCKCMFGRFFIRDFIVFCFKLGKIIAIKYPREFNAKNFRFIAYSVIFYFLFFSYFIDFCAWLVLTEDMMEGMDFFETTEKEDIFGNLKRGKPIMRYSEMLLEVMKEAYYEWDRWR